MTTKNKTLSGRARRAIRKRNKQRSNSVKLPKKIKGFKDGHRVASRVHKTIRSSERQAFSIGRVGKTLDRIDEDGVKQMATLTVRQGAKVFKGQPRNRVNGVSLAGFAMPVRKTAKGRKPSMGRGFSYAKHLPSVQSDDANAVASRMLFNKCPHSAARIQELTSGMAELSAFGKYHKGLKEPRNYTRGKSGGKLK